MLIFHDAASLPQMMIPIITSNLFETTCRVNNPLKGQPVRTHGNDSEWPSPKQKHDTVIARRGVDIFLHPRWPLAFVFSRHRSCFPQVTAQARQNFSWMVLMCSWSLQFPGFPGFPSITDQVVAWNLDISKVSWKKTHLANYLPVKKGISLVGEESQFGHIQPSGRLSSFRDKSW